MPYSNQILSKTATPHSAFGDHIKSASIRRPASVSSQKIKGDNPDCA
jgi:hypothetical protein